jgi:hypothetical protein
MSLVLQRSNWYGEPKNIGDTFRLARNAAVSSWRRVQAHRSRARPGGYRTQPVTANSFSKCREARCCAVIATQTYESFVAKLRNEDVAAQLIANIRTKIWRCAEDNYAARQAPICVARSSDGRSAGPGTRALDAARIRFSTATSSIPPSRAATAFRACPPLRPSSQRLPHEAARQGACLPAHIHSTDPVAAPDEHQTSARPRQAHGVGRSALPSAHSPTRTHSSALAPPTSQPLLCVDSGPRSTNASGVQSTQLSEPAV